MCILCSLGNSLTDENIREAQKMCSNPPSIEYQRAQLIFDAFRTLLKVAKRYDFHMEDYFKGMGRSGNSVDNSRYDTSFEVRNARKEFIERLDLNVNDAENKELNEIINVVNSGVTTTTNGIESVENIKDLKDFLNQALLAWQNVIEIINVVNNVVTTTTNGVESVENIEELKDFLNQALPAWQNAMQNQTVFQQQFHQFPPRT
jgi:hypothetical protein